MLAVSSPLARRLLTIVAILSIAVTGASTLATFAFVQQDVAAREMAQLRKYVAERTKTEDALFSDLVQVQLAATDSLLRKMTLLDDAMVDQLFEKNFPLAADGTRRTADSLYDGNSYAYGIGGFIADGRNVSMFEKRLMVAGLQVVAHTGEAELRRYDNFYMFTPQTNRFVMFGPTRPDRLMFYRKTAPSNLDIRDDEMVHAGLPANNPQRVLRCTALDKLISNPATVTSVCTTPIDINGRHVASWGTTVPVNSYLTRVVQDGPTDSTNMLVTTQGQLIAYPGIGENGVVTAAVMARAQKDHKIGEMVEQIRRHGQDIGVFRSTIDDQVIAYGLLKEPNWYFVMAVSSKDIFWSAMRTASWVLLFGLTGMAAQILLLYRFARTAMLDPIRLLAREAWGAGGHADALQDRRDEIGLLSRALRWQKVKNEDLLRSLEDRVAERTEALERANRAKSQFLANMSHELRTPLNGVIAIADQLGEGDLPPERRRDLAALVTGSGRLLEQVLSDILDVSKIEAGQFTLHDAPFDLGERVRLIAELHRAAAEAKGLAFGWSVDPDAAGAYLGDAARISQILSNLLSNAIKFTESGEVRLTVDRTPDGLRFCVRDTGVGFDDEVLARLFRRFEQADDSITRRFGGTGLGLSICASLAEMMGGSIEARSVLGQGATFEVRLPLPSARLETAAAEPQDDPADEAGGLSGLRVLAAEDHPTNRKVLEIILERSGVQMTMVENGREAVDAADKMNFDVILMDMQMPVMDGLSAIRLIRERETREDRPPAFIVMLTAAAMDENIAQSYSAGADLHVAKPIRPAELLSALMQATTAPAYRARQAV